MSLKVFKNLWMLVSGEDSTIYAGV